MYRQQARREWEIARKKGFWTGVRAHLGGRQVSILDFDTVAQQLDLRNAFYRGAENVPLKSIVGSVGRYQDFVTAFLPTTDAMRDRWQNVAALYINPDSGGAPPIELYKVGEVYFVRDGNHRVSVANQIGLVDIEAYVWEYPGYHIDLSTGLDIDNLLLERERSAFLEQSGLHELRPDHGIRLTVPGGYHTMLGQMIYYQYALSQIDGEEVPFPEAVTAWYDMIYDTTVQLIDEAGVLENFPDRTQADFFIWLLRHHREMEECYGQPILMEEAARKLEEQNRPVLPVRLWRRLQRLVRRKPTG